MYEGGLAAEDFVAPRGKVLAVIGDGAVAVLHPALFTEPMSSAVAQTRSVV